MKQIRMIDGVNKLSKEISMYFTILLKGRLVSFIGAALLFSCTQSDKPAGILSKTQMVRILSEVYITEEKLNRLGVRHDSAAQIFPIMKDSIFSDFNVSDSIFQRSLRYYWDRPKEMEEIYAALVDSLNLKEQRMPMTHGDSISE